jgi:ankyrin repeat protein
LCFVAVDRTMKRNHAGENVPVKSNVVVHSADSAMHMAIENGNRKELKILLQNGEIPCFKSRENCFMLTDDWEITLQLLQAEPKGVRAKDTNGYTLLSKNINDLNHVKYLVNLGSDPLEFMNDFCDPYCRSSEDVLEFAVTNAPIEVLYYLLDIGTLARTDRVIRKVDYLLKAISTGDIEKVKLIMQAGVNSDHLNNLHHAPLPKNFVRNPEILKLLHKDKPLEKRILNNCLMCAVETGNPSILNLLFHYGAEVSSNEYGNKLLIKSLKYPDIVKILLKKGLDPNAVHNDGHFDYTALILSVKIKEFDTITSLLIHGANLNKTDKNGYTALMYAVDWPLLVKYLLERGADPSLNNKNGQTALIKAVQYPESVKYLLEYGADVQVADYKGDTALMKAVPYPDSVKLLLQYRALLWIRNEDGKNALDLTFKHHEFPPKDEFAIVRSNDDLSTIELLLEVACEENVNLYMSDWQGLFDIYAGCYDQGVNSDSECSYFSDESDEDEDVHKFKPGYHTPPFENTFLKKGFIARLAGILPPKLLTKILQDMHSKGWSCEVDPETLSPITSLLLARLHHEGFGTTLENLKMFLNAGMNVGQRLLEFHDRQMFEISDQLQVPDCLLLALMLGKRCKNILL